MSERIFNFSAGPAVLPVPVLETVRENILSYGKSGIGIMELASRLRDSKMPEGVPASLDVDHTMTLMTEETFGPAVGIMKVDSDDEAIRLVVPFDRTDTRCVT